MSNNASKGYQFTLLNGQITGVSEIKNGRIKFERMDADEAWSYDAASGQVSKTEWDDGRLETTLYTDANGDGIFSKAGKSYGSLNTSIDTPVAQSQQEGYKFTVADGAVTGVFEIEHGTTRSKSMDAGETWTLQANQVIKTELEHGVTETTVYSDANGDGIFAKVSKSYDVGGTLVTAPVTELSGHHGGLGSDDILVGGQGTDDLTGGSGADVFDFNNLTELGLGRTHDTIQDFRVGDHDKIDLSDMDANPLLAGNQAFVFLSGAPDAGNQTGTAWFNQGNLYLSTDADSAAEFEIAVVGVSALTAADLVL